VTRLLVPIVAFAVGLGGALALASCGDDEEGLLPGNTAEDILENLERVEQRAEEQDCSGAAEAAERVAVQIEELGTEVNERLKRALSEGADQLQDVVDTCEEEPVAPVEPDTTEIPTEETTDTVETDEGDEDDEESEGPPETTDTTTPTTDTVPTTPTTPTAPVPTPDEGGDGEPGSGSGGIGPGRVTEGD
jgi:hypothetical protein